MASDEVRGPVTEESSEPAPAPAPVDGDAGSPPPEPGSPPASPAPDGVAPSTEAPASAAPETSPRPLDTPPRGAKALAFCALGIVACLAADLGTKRWAESALAIERHGELPGLCVADEHGSYRYQRVRRLPHVIIEGYFDLEYAENCGAAFGLLRTAPAWMRGAVFDTAAVVASIVLLVLFRRGRGGRAFAWSVPLVVSGALGNLFDRLANGYVVDFIHVHVGASFDYPTFNVADIAIAIGVTLLIIDGLRHPEGAAPEVSA